MRCHSCGYSDGNDYAAQQQMLAQVQAHNNSLGNGPYYGLGLFGYGQVYQPVDQIQAAIWFDQNPQLSGWRETAAEWDKIP